MFLFQDKVKSLTIVIELNRAVRRPAAEKLLLTTSCDFSETNCITSKDIPSALAKIFSNLDKESKWQLKNLSIAGIKITKEKIIRNMLKYISLNIEWADSPNISINYCQLSTSCLETLVNKIPTNSCLMFSGTLDSEVEISTLFNSIPLHSRGLMLGESVDDSSVDVITRNSFRLSKNDNFKINNINGLSEPHMRFIDTMFSKGGNKSALKISIRDNPKHIDTQKSFILTIYIEPHQTNHIEFNKLSKLPSIISSVFGELYGCVLDKFSITSIVLSDENVIHQIFKSISLNVLWSSKPSIIIESCRFTVPCLEPFMVNIPGGSFLEINNTLHSDNEVNTFFDSVPLHVKALYFCEHFVNDDHINGILTNVSRLTKEKNFRIYHDSNLSEASWESVRAICPP